MIKIGRWAYDATRGLAVDCKNPAASDEVLNKYRVSTSVVTETINADSNSRRRGGGKQSTEDLESVSEKRFVYLNDDIIKFY
jgi:hypothetical protein